MNGQTISEVKPSLFADYLTDSGMVDLKKTENGFKSLSRLISVSNISVKSLR